MHKVVNNRIIHAHHKSPQQLWSIVLASLSVFLIVLGALGLVYVQQPLREESLDTRKDASVAQGPVEITTSFSGITGSDNKGQVQFNFNSHNLPVTKMELVFNVISPVFSQDAEKTPVIHADFTGSSTRITDQEMEKTSDGYLVSLVIEPKQGTSLATNTTKTFAVLDFVAKQSGSLTIPFDPNASKVFVSGEPTTDKLKHVASSTYTVTAQTTAPQQESIYFVDNQIDTRFYRTDGSEIWVYSMQQNQNYRAKITYQIQNLLKGINVPTEKNLRAMVILNVEGQDRQSKERSYLDLTTSTSGFSDTIEFDYTPTDNILPIKLSVYLKEDTAATATTNQAVTTLYDTWTITYSLGATGGTAAKVCNDNCSNNSECPTNHRCYENRCRLVTNLSSSNCSAPPDNGLQRTCNQYCADTQECAAGFSCHYNRCRRPNNLESTICALPSVALQQAIADSCNDSCADNGDCANNMRCYNRMCRLATNPGSTTCTAATQPSVSTKYYSNGGPTKGTPSAADRTATASAKPTATIKPSTSSAQASAAARLATPTPIPTPQGQAIVKVSPSPIPVVEPTGNFFQRLFQSGITFPAIALAIGVIILLIVGIMTLVNILKNRNQTPPGTASLKQKTPYEAELQQRIDSLKNQQTPTTTGPVIPSAAAEPPMQTATFTQPPMSDSQSSITPAPEPTTLSSSSADLTPPPSTLKVQPETKTPEPPQASSPTPPATSMMERIRQKGINPPDSTSEPGQE